MWLDKLPLWLLWVRLKLRISFARLLIEIDVTKEIIKDPSGVVLNQEVVYDWVPPFCNTCKVVGHNCELKKLSLIRVLRNGFQNNLLLLRHQGHLLLLSLVLKLQLLCPSPRWLHLQLLNIRLTQMMMVVAGRLYLGSLRVKGLCSQLLLPFGVLSLDVLTHP